MKSNTGLLAGYRFAEGHSNTQVTISINLKLLPTAQDEGQPLRMKGPLVMNHVASNGIARNDVRYIGDGPWHCTINWHGNRIANRGYWIGDWYDSHGNRNRHVRWRRGHFLNDVGAAASDYPCVCRRPDYGFGTARTCGPVASCTLTGLTVVGHFCYLAEKKLCENC